LSVIPDGVAFFKIEPLSIAAIAEARTSQVTGPRVWSLPLYGIAQIMSEFSVVAVMSPKGTA
jgi:hypothetical protein